MKKKVVQKVTYVVGVDEAGEKRRLGASQEVVDIFDQSKKMSYNLNSSCKEGVLIKLSK